MPLLSLWKSDPATVLSFTVEQVVSFAGDGKLRDGSLCSQEFREYLSSATSDKIFEYIDYCLTNSFSSSGSVLQDLVNELGRRLDYEVENGLYSGKIGAIGNDGLWRSPDEGSLVVEVKTSDAYRISVDTIAEYRKKLMMLNKIDEKSSILIVVGRQDTGELEAQVRGSKHAWDVRLISAEALGKLVSLKENADEVETARKIRGVLVPVEYTKVDALVDVLFTTASDLEPQTVISPDEGAAEDDTLPYSKGLSPRSSEFTDSRLLQSKRDQIVQSMSANLGAALVKKSRATFWTADHTKRIACTLSKRYDSKIPYWYAYHPAWNDFLLEADQGYFVLGCMDQEFVFSIPVSDVQPLLPHLNTTTLRGKTYWHIHLVEPDPGRFRLVIPNREYQDLALYQVPLTSSTFS